MATKKKEARGGGGASSTNSYVTIVRKLGLVHWTEAVNVTAPAKGSSTAHI